MYSPFFPKRSTSNDQFTRRVVASLLVSMAILGHQVALAAQALYATDTSTQELYELSPDDASATLVGPFGVDGFMADLAYDENHDILYGVTTGTDRLYTIDRTTGAATEIGPLRVGLMHALAYDSVNDVLYGAKITRSGLYRIDTTTGEATLVGSTGLPSLEGISGMDFDPLDNTLYGSLASPSRPGSIYRIDLTNGHASFVVSTVRLSDLAFHPETGVLYGINNQGGLLSDALYTIDLNDGSYTEVGPTGLGNNLGLAFAPVTDTTNAPPFVDCPTSLDAECGTPVTVEIQVGDPDGDPLLVLWTLNGVPVQTNEVSGSMTGGTSMSLSLLLADPALGTNAVTALVSDSLNEPVSCTTEVRVEDTHPPVILAAEATPDVLWPPNNKPVHVKLQATVEDACSSVTWAVKSISCSETDHEASDLWFGAPHEVTLRATRSGSSREGRVYRIGLQAEDEAGNTSEMFYVDVTVPHDRRPQPGS